MPNLVKHSAKCLAHSKYSANISGDEDDDFKEENDNEADLLISAFTTSLVLFSDLEHLPLSLWLIQILPILKTLKKPSIGSRLNISFGSTLAYLILIISFILPPPGRLYAP